MCQNSLDMWNIDSIQVQKCSKWFTSILQKCYIDYTIRMQEKLHQFIVRVSKDQFRKPEDKQASLSMALCQ